MAEFRMPSLGADMTSGVLTEWLVQPGQRVRRGDIVAVVETDKGAIEIEIFEDAVIGELLVAPGTEVPVGATLASLVPGVDFVDIGAPAPTVTAPKVVPGVDIVDIAGVQPLATRRKVSPAARRRAREEGIDIDAVAATGHGDVVTLADVERAIAATPPAAARPPPPPPLPAKPPAPQRTATTAPSATPMRRAIAAAMSRSKREIPHYYLAQTIDVEGALRTLEQRNRERRLDQRVLPGALLLHAVVRALADAPALNGTWQDDRFVPAARIDLGVIINLRGGGLAAPTLADVAARDLDALMAALREVTQRARAGRLRSSDLGAASITVSSLGDSDVDALWPVIHPPQVAIVGFGGIVTRPWVVDGGLHVRRVVTATLAADHRASDGHVGARFLTALARALQRPEAP
jgi:pyruvate dehydrogenase E2 component (dihydrolipoamide acetyltransferase)